MSAFDPKRTSASPATSDVGGLRPPFHKARLCRYDVKSSHEAYGWSGTTMAKQKKGNGNNSGKMKRKVYEKELHKLQVELCHLQEWVKAKGLKVIIVFEGRDAAGKGGTIKALTERVCPRVFRVVALPAPTDREKTLMYMQRYIERFPAAGEIVIFDRSWYNRAGVEH